MTAGLGQPHEPARHTRWQELGGQLGSSARGIEFVRHFSDVAAAPRTMATPWMTKDELAPPYAKHVGRAALAHGGPVLTASA